MRVYEPVIFSFRLRANHIKTMMNIAINKATIIAEPMKKNESLYNDIFLCVVLVDDVCIAVVAIGRLSTKSNSLIDNPRLIGLE